MNCQAILCVGTKNVTKKKRENEFFANANGQRHEWKAQGASAKQLRRIERWEENFDDDQRLTRFYG